MKDDNAIAAFEQWAIVEVMGHRRYAGFVREVTIAGAGFIRVDVPGADGGPIASPIFAPSAIYCITPCTEETARKAAAINQVAPVTQWELPAPPDDDDRNDDGEVLASEETMRSLSR